MSRGKKFLLGVLCVAAFPIASVWTAAPVLAGRPGGVGANLHRSFMIRRAQRRAARGLPTTRHTGIWLSGGYESTVGRRRSPSRAHSYHSYRTHTYRYGWRR